MSSDLNEALAYRALALQAVTIAVNRCNGREEARAEMQRSIKRLAEEIGASKGWIGKDLKLVVLPEYFLTGFPMGDSFGSWADKAALEINGPEYESLGKIAQDCKIYLSGNVYEKDPNFPDIYFQASFAISPTGDVILRYRRLISMFSPSPYDYLDKYLDIYGEDALFPVADTDIGRIACIASEEILYPELARCLALKGAEIFLHSSSEAGSPKLTQKGVAKRARAQENLAYVVSANSGGVHNYSIGAQSTDGGSQIVDFNGLVLSEAAGGNSMTANSEIDLGALRRNRLRPGMPNMLSRQPTELYAKHYAKTPIVPPNFLLNEDGNPKKAERSYFIERQQNVIALMEERGILTK